MRLGSHLLVSLAQESDELLGTFNEESKMTSVAAPSRTICLSVSPEDATGSHPTETPLPCRRMLTFEVDAGGDDAKVSFELWEAKEAPR